MATVTIRSNQSNINPNGYQRTGASVNTAAEMAKANMYGQAARGLGVAADVYRAEQDKSDKNTLLDAIQNMLGE